MVVRNAFFYVVGICFLILAKGKNLLQGYSSPKTVDFADLAKCIDYDIRVVDSWLMHLQNYTRSEHTLRGKNVLELGPGSDCGIGLYLVSLGCSQYNAIDVNDLMKSTPPEFYDQFFKKLETLNSSVDIGSLHKRFHEMGIGKQSGLNCIVRDDFDLVSAFGESSIDLVFSQAVLEHLDDCETTFEQLSAVCRPGAVLISEIDLQTHSRWIRTKDPNNIYRYPPALYSLFRFRGIPNRFRPYQYKEILQRFGWTDIAVIPLETIPDRESCSSGLYEAFLDEKNQMNHLTIMLCARMGERI